MWEEDIIIKGYPCILILFKHSRVTIVISIRWKKITIRNWDVQRKTGAHIVCQECVWDWGRNGHTSCATQRMDKCKGMATLWVCNTTNGQMQLQVCRIRLLPFVFQSSQLQGDFFFLQVFSVKICGRNGLIWFSQQNFLTVEK